MWHTLLMLNRTLVAPPGEPGLLIHVRGDYYAIVDPGEEWLAGYSWHLYRARNTAYACHSFRGKDGKAFHVYMHHFLLPALPRGSTVDVDHIDGDGLNNRRSNLRHLLHSENVAAGWARRLAERSG